MYGRLMRQNRLFSLLGGDLRDSRRALSMTQADLASRVGCSLPTTRQLEQGRGTLAVLTVAASILGVHLNGRNLPGGTTVGIRLATLRQRRGLSRRAVAAELADVSATTVAVLEASSVGHVSIAVRVAEALGVQLRLTPLNSVEFWSTTAVSSAADEWTTPSWLLERLYPLVGGAFSLDPCSPARRGANATVRARLRYVAEDDGLAQAWRAKSIYMNPPYGRGLPRWVEKARAEVEVGRAATVIGLVPARTDTRWWHEHVAGLACVWLLKGRLAFGDGTAAAPFPSALLLWGGDEHLRSAISRAFPDAWHVPRRG